MKRFLNIFLSISLFFNLGFAFSGVKASALPVPLRVYGNETFSIGDLASENFRYRPDDRDDIAEVELKGKLALYRVTALENLLGAIYLQQSSSGISYDIANADSFFVMNALGLVKGRVFVSLFDVDEQKIISDRISEIKYTIDITNQRIKDLNDLIRAFIIEEPLSYPVSGVDNNFNTMDVNAIRQELFMAKVYKNFLEESLLYWSNLGRTPLITSISPLRAKPGDLVTINGARLQSFSAALLYIPSSSPFLSPNPTPSRFAKIKITESNFISPNRIDFILPRINNFIGESKTNLVLFGSESDTFWNDKRLELTYVTSSCNPPPSCIAPQPGCSYINIPKDGNGCITGCGTLSCPDGDPCRCPGGQVFLSVGGVRKCATINTGNVTCSRYGNKPVCGCGGVTYQNSCYALINGLKSFTSGACN